MNNPDTIILRNLAKRYRDICAHPREGGSNALRSRDARAPQMNGTGQTERVAR